MKTMTCKQLGGACQEKLSANTFDEIAELSKNHCMQMFQSEDAAHLSAMAAMQALMKEEGAMQAWFENKRKEFNALPDD